MAETASARAIITIKIVWITVWIWWIMKSCCTWLGFIQCHTLYRHLKYSGAYCSVVSEEPSTPKRKFWSVSEILFIYETTRRHMPEEHNPDSQLQTSQPSSCSHCFLMLNDSVSVKTCSLTASRRELQGITGCMISRILKFDATLNWVVSFTKPVHNLLGGRPKVPLWTWSGEKYFWPYH